MQHDPKTPPMAWLWQEIQEQDQEKGLRLRDRFLVQQRLYNAWTKKERARKTLAQVQRRVGGKRPIGHYEKKLAEAEERLQQLTEAATHESPPA